MTPKMTLLTLMLMPAPKSLPRVNLREFLPKMRDQNFNLDNYLNMFEKVSKMLNWPKSSWVSYLVPQLNQRCVEVYARAPVSRCTDYAWLKIHLYDKYSLGIET